MGDLIDPPDGLRTLLGPGPERAYAWDSGVRALMLASLDGIVTGEDGRSGSLGDEADHWAYATNRRLADVVVVGAGTARAEEYGMPDDGMALVVVTRRGDLPARLLDRARSDARAPLFLATTTAAAPSAEQVLGTDRVWTLGERDVSPTALRDRLRATGRTRILLEGGPELLTGWLAHDVVDELCLTQVPRLLGAGRPLLSGPLTGCFVEPVSLLEHRGTLLGRWRRRITAPQQA